MKVKDFIKWAQENDALDKELLTIDTEHSKRVLTEDDPIIDEDAVILFPLVY